MQSSPVNRSVQDAVFLVAVGIMIWLLAVAMNFHENLDQFLHTHEAWQLDEIFVALNVSGLLCLLYAVRRIGDLKTEIRLRNQLEANMDWLTNHDPLTSLFNRRALDVYGRMLNERRDGKCRIAYSINLDGFKKVNDLVGHQGGDILLRDVAQRLRQVLPDAESFRLGSDEFLAVSCCPVTADYLRIGQQIIQTLSAPYDVGGMTSEIGASVGYALYLGDSSDFNDVVHCAGVAMSAAKKAGPNNVFAYERIMEDRVVRRAETEMALKRAIRDHAIKPYYQPLIDLKSGEVRGFEALARWKTGPQSYIPPCDFIELAEHTGLIVELSDNLLRQACRDALHWPDSVRLAFNISPILFIDRHLGLRIMTILAETGYPPHRLEIEITETALIRDMNVAAGILHDLREAGIRIALDDFGTGYSSLSQLSKFQFDKIKIDRSFVMNFDSDKKQGDIVRAIIGLGQGLGVSITAEGIEDMRQLEFLKNLGCDFGQGYLFGKAIPADQALYLLSQQPDTLTGTSSAA